MYYSELCPKAVKIIKERKSGKEIAEEEKLIQEKEAREKEKRKIRTLPGCIRLEDLNKMFGFENDGKICDFVNKLNSVETGYKRIVKPKLGRGGDPQFERKYIEIFKDMLKAEKEENSEQ